MQWGSQQTKTRRGSICAQGNEGDAMLDFSREFLVLAKHANFVKAADELHLSQPSLTRHIASLERELGFRLFDRPSMQLTPAGRFYLGTISNLISELDEIVEQGRRIDAEHDEGVSVSMIVSSNNQWADIVYESMSLLQSRHPYSSPARLFNDDQLTIASSVFLGKADVGVMFSIPADIPEGFACELLFEPPLLVWLHKDNPLSQRPCITLEDLQDCYLVNPTTPNLLTTFEGAVETFRKHGIEPKHRARTLTEFDRIPFTLQPDEMLFKTANDARIPIPASFLVETRFAEPGPRYQVYLLYRKEPANSLVADFVRICHEVAATRMMKNEPTSGA
ncbi:LysR family transcriptional regulator [Eggerthella sp. HF-4214]|uniref:LysR family transcriptional regulator n=2 Tax=Eggerthella guodeyinii TaxID=2690837 RepID=A0A6N7RRS6_9ACTN|nr:LysR family transcriptional regulator [Eggerthella guodeyinii]